MLSSGVSDDLPLYLKSQYTPLNPPIPPKKPLKTVKPILRQGVSSDSPLFFQLDHVAIVNNSLRNKEISGKDREPGRFLSSLKQNNLNFKPKFDYSDSQLCQFDYHCLKPSKIIDLVADKSPKTKNSTQFCVEFNKYLTKGFGKSRGQCTLESMQPNVPRYQLGQIDVLKNRLNLTRNNEHKFRIGTGKTVMNQTQPTFASLTPSVQSKTRSLQRRVSTPLSLNEIDEFELRKRTMVSPIEKRQIYSMD